MAIDLPPRLLELVELTYAAVEVPDNWKALLRRLVAMFPGTCVSLFVRARNKWDEVMGLEEGYPFGAIDSYLANFDANGPWNVIEIRSTVGVAYACEDFVPFAELQTTDFYRDWCVPYGLGAGFGVKLFDDADSFGSLLVDCSPALAPLIDRDIRQTLSVLAPHVRQALRLATALKRFRQAALTDLVTSKTTAALIVDADLTVSAANAAAERMRDLGWLKWQALGSALALRSAGDTERLRAQLRTPSMVASHVEPARWLLPLVDETLEDLAVLDVTPLQSVIYRDGAEGGILDPVRRSSFLVRLRLRSDLPLPLAEDLESTLGLSDLESQAVVALIGGQSIEQQAVARGVTTDAIRWHFRNIYQKLGCKSQIELARIVLGLLQR